MTVTRGIKVDDVYIHQIGTIQVTKLDLNTVRYTVRAFNGYILDKGQSYRRTYQSFTRAFLPERSSIKEMRVRFNSWYYNGAADEELERMVGLSREELQSYLENTCYENYNVGIQDLKLIGKDYYPNVDHIIPVAYTEDPSIWHFTNFQILTREDNSKKGSYYDGYRWFSQIGVATEVPFVFVPQDLSYMLMSYVS